MTLKEYLKETYDILGAKIKNKEAPDGWNKKIKEYDEKLSSISDEEWKEAKRKAAHDIIDEVNQRKKTHSDNVKATTGIDDEYKPALTGSKIFRDPAGRKIKKKTILQKEIDEIIKDAERDRKLAKLFRNGPDDDDI